MFKKYLYLILFLSINFIYSQDNFTISGYVMSSESNELVIGANIVFPEINSGAITNSYGFFSITIPEGDYKVEISSIGFKNISEKILLQKDLKVNYYLEENIENLNEVVVTKNVEEIDIKKPVMSYNNLHFCCKYERPIEKE